jgi:hypothetical protein
MASNRNIPWYLQTLLRKLAEVGGGLQEQQIQLLVTLSSQNAANLCKFRKHLERAHSSLDLAQMGRYL